jgi:hypothetical protein
VTGYKFTSLEAGPAYRVHVSRAEPGQLHQKQYAQATWYPSGRTLNLYASGRFELSCAHMKATMVAGQSSADWPVSIPAGLIVDERPLEPGVRVCIEGPPDWPRERFEIAEGEELGGVRMLAVYADKIEVATYALGPCYGLFLPE